MTAHDRDRGTDDAGLTRGAPVVVGHEAPLPPSACESAGAGGPSVGERGPAVDLDVELTRDIGYALSRSPFKAKGQPIEALRIVAAGVVRQLRLSGWVFALLPPVAPHGPTLPESRTGPGGTSRAGLGAGLGAIPDAVSGPISTVERPGPAPQVTPLSHRKTNLGA